MATVTIRNLDNDAYARLKREAGANHRSVEAELRHRLEHGEDRAAAARAWVDRLRAARIDPGPDYEGSVALIRAIRDEE